MKKKISAAELVATLNADAALVARRAQEDRERLQREAESRAAEEALVRDLRTAGYEVESVWDLVNSTAAYPEALPVLLEHLARPYPAVVREGIARALAVPEARFCLDILVRMYREEQARRAKDGLAVAIAAVSDDEVIGDVIDLARDRRHGSSRLLLLTALERSKDPRALEMLVELERDPELGTEIRFILGRLKSRKR